jgi:hypothetical protein
VALRCSWPSWGVVNDAVTMCNVGQLAACAGVVSSTVLRRPVLMTTRAHLARIDGKNFVVQFFADGPLAGELATAFVPSQQQLSAMLRAGG